ncbi:Putative HpcH/HpaI aldolase/citrate lyase [Arachis hypogaea]|nr:Putative HpcH/HpaI aldolase/citrate lyase [Arachis hypogaea]
MRYLWDPENRNVMQLTWEVEAKILKRHSGGGFSMGTYLSGFAMLHDRSGDLNSQVTWVSHGV